MAIIGIDIGGTNIRVGFVENNKLERVESLEIKSNCTEKEMINDIISMIVKFDIKKVEGIGVGVPSVVDVEKGIVYDVQNIPAWKEVHLKKIMEAEFNIPVYVNNDANCFTVGEKYFGSVKEYQNIVGLIIGTGLGAGIIINNYLYAGNNCGAGEFGMIPFKDKNYEYYCSGQYFPNEHGISGKELFARAFGGDSIALDIFSKFGTNLGEAIKMIMYAIDPQVIVFGGSVSKSFNFFKEEMWKSINSFAYSKSISRLKIEISETNHIAILGAAALYLDAKANK
jgi:glucokinase